MPPTDVFEADFEPLDELLQKDLSTMTNDELVELQRTLTRVSLDQSQLKLSLKSVHVDNPVEKEMKRRSASAKKPDLFSMGLFNLKL